MSSEAVVGIPFYPKGWVGRIRKLPPGVGRRAKQRDPYDWL